MDPISVIPSPERVAMFVDNQNIEAAMRHAGMRVEMADMVDYALGKRMLQECFCYIASNLQPERWTESQARVRALQNYGYIVRTKPSQVLPNGQLKCDLDVELTLDAYEYCRLNRPDTAIILSGDGHLAALAIRLRLMGIRVEIAAMPGSISAELRASSNGFIDLSQLAERVEHLTLPELTPAETSVADKVIDSAAAQN